MKSRIALAAVMALTFVGASWPLNPLVTRTAQPTGPVPAGCEEGLAPAPTPRVIVAEIPERELIVPVSMPAPPPSRSLREELDAAQRALERNDRPAFDEHLHAARGLVASYPPGGERSRAEEVVWALNDAAVLWDAQFESPFFEETSDAYTRANRYAGFSEAVRRGVLTDDHDRRFYPASESREFVTRIAAERLERLGVRGSSSMPRTRTIRAETPAPRRHTAPSVTADSSSSPAPSPSPSRSRRRTTTRSSSSSSHRKSSPTHKAGKPTALAKSAPSSSPAPAAVAPSPAPAEPAPTTPPVSAPTSSATDSATAPASPVGDDVPTPIATDSATTTAAPVTTSSSPEPTPASSPAAPAERRSVFIPALLILIGLGVLVVLFRASK
jgi:hypothetical protein